jgi:small subunit ribosomal protein S20
MVSREAALRSGTVLKPCHTVLCEKNHALVIALLKIWNLHPSSLPLPSKIQEYMANHKATKKDVRQATKRRERNRYYGKTTRNAVRDFRELKTKKEAGDQLPEIASEIDKLAKRGIIHKNKAANLKSKLAKRTNALAK